MFVSLLTTLKLTLCTRQHSKTLNKGSRCFLKDGHSVHRIYSLSNQPLISKKLSGNKSLVSVKWANIMKCSIG